MVSHVVLYIRLTAGLTEVRRRGRGEEEGAKCSWQKSLGGLLYDDTKRGRRRVTERRGNDLRGELKEMSMRKARHDNKTQ